MAKYAPIRAQDEWFDTEDKLLVFTVKDKAGAVVDVSGWVSEWKLFTSDKDTSAEITKPGVVTDGPNGKITVTVGAVDVAGKGGRKYAQRFRRTDEASMLAYGEVVLKR